MECAELGWSGIRVSRVCIGGMSFGRVFPDFHQWVIDQPATQDVIARALDGLVRAGKVRAHELVGLIGRPGKKPLAGTDARRLK